MRPFRALVVLALLALLARSEVVVKRQRMSASTFSSENPELIDLSSSLRDALASNDFERAAEILSSLSTLSIPSDYFALTTLPKKKKKVTSDKKEIARLRLIIDESRSHQRKEVAKLKAVKAGVRRSSSVTRPQCPKLTRIIRSRPSSSPSTGRKPQ